MNGVGNKHERNEHERMYIVRNESKAKHERDQRQALGTKNPIVTPFERRWVSPCVTRKLKRSSATWTKTGTAK